jgi:hypothetical protein
MNTQKDLNKEFSKKNAEKGSALVIALFVLVLVTAFVILATSRSAAEASAVGNEAAEGRTVYAAQGSLEVMTRNFNKVFERKLSPNEADLNTVRDENRVTIIPGMENYTFFNELDEIPLTAEEETVVLPGGPYAGLYAIRSTYRLRTTATDPVGTQVELTRNILNNQIPIFQFGIFYDDDLELYRPPLFSFGGRVHSNRHFFLSPGSEGVYFDSRVTAAGHIVTETWRNGNTGDNYNGTWIKDAAGVNRQLSRDMGSVLNGPPNSVFGSGKWANTDMPSSRLNTDWETDSAIFDGNLQAEVKPLKLPLKVGEDADQNDLIEMVKRGKQAPGASGGDVFDGTADNDIMRSERFANKTGIRVSLADSKAKLPGCSTTQAIPGTAVTTACGVRLDGHMSGDGTEPAAKPGTIPYPLPANANLWSRGYQPRPMKLSSSDTGFGYIPTRVNGERLYTGGSRQVWIKIETVRTNDTTGAIETTDITEDILSLGVTEETPATWTVTGNSGTLYAGSRAADNNGSATSPSSNLLATVPQTATTYPDSRSVIKIQRFSIPGPSIPVSASPGPYSIHNTASGGYNYIRRYTNVDPTKILNGCPTALPATTAQRCTASNGDPTIEQDERYGHLLFDTTPTGTTNDYALVPFPIKIYDSREGAYFDDAARYTANTVTRNGVMSLIDIDVANLRRFLRGDFNGLFPTNTPFATTNGSLVASWNPSSESDIPQNEGYVFYVSDRRGDADFDGEYDMEDIYGNSPGNDGNLQPGEDANANGTLEAKYIQPNSNACVGFATTCEAPRYADTWVPDVAAVTDTKYYRRGVRLINGTTIPGIYDSATSSNTRGFTVSSENGIYVKGNYNATHVTSVPALGNSPFNNYRPVDDAVHVPASVVADGVTILSNNWRDAESFVSPHNKETSPGYRQATETTIRFAMISGDTIATREASPNQGGISPRLNGGVHNFKRFLEKWTGDNLNYSGSLINLFNSRNNAGAFKCCSTVYDPPRRNWVFDSTFLDPSRIPPGTPFFQYIQTTGFRRGD